MLYRKMMRLLANMRFRTYILASMRVLALALGGDWDCWVVSRHWGLASHAGDLMEGSDLFGRGVLDLPPSHLLVLGAAAVAIIALEVGLPLALLVGLIRFLWKRA